MTVHIMVDLETRSSRMDAAIMSIGAVAFDPLGDEWRQGRGGIGKAPKLAWDRVFQVNVERQSALRLGFHESEDTMQWWAEQPAAALDAATSNPLRITEALDKFRFWLLERVDAPSEDFLREGEVRIWSHATFDAAILNYTYQVATYGHRPPWHYRDTDDLRTLQRLAFGYGKSGENVPIPDVGHKHEAVYDAWRQSLIVQACFDNIQRVDGRTSV